MLTKFPFIANDISLDFANTQIRNHGEVIDLVATPEKLIRWMEAIGISSISAEWKVSDVAAFKVLRKAIREVMEAQVSSVKPPKSAIGQINDALSHYVESFQLIWEDDGYCFIERQSDLTPPMVLGVLAKYAAKLLVSEERSRIKRCSNPECILLFKDTSKSGKRRWCDMKTCGNRSKARTYRTNQK